MPDHSQAEILHADLDAFYASVEQMLDPSLAGRPIAVGGSVVLAASYEARACGVKGGMPGWSARRLCPEIRFVAGHFREYQRLGDEVMSVFYDFTPVVERVSIDEAFLDVGGSVRLFGPPPEIAKEIRTRVRTDVGLPVSIGVARTKHLAKVASQVAKPDGLVVVDPEREREFLGPLPIRLIWGVGPATEARLTSIGISTIGQLAETDSPILQRLLGQAAGSKLSDLSSNIDRRHVVQPDRAKSMGAQAALGRATVTSELLRETLGFLADRVTSRLRAAGRAGRTVTVRVRFSDLRSVTRSLTLPAPVATTLTATEVAVELAGSALRDHPNEREISLLALSISALTDQVGLQLELPVDGAPNPPRPGQAVGSARWGIDCSIDAVREKFGRRAVGYASIVFSDHDRVPDEFRELAEKPDGRSQK